MKLFIAVLCAITVAGDLKSDLERLSDLGGDDKLIRDSPNFFLLLPLQLIALLLKYGFDMSGYNEWGIKKG